MNKLKAYNWYRRIISVVYPNRCPFCKEIISADRYYCSACYRVLPFCLRKPEIIGDDVKLISCCKYVGVVRDAVLWFKYGGVFYPADAFALMMTRRLRAMKVSADIIVPVPSGRENVQKRGFSSAKVIAQRISMRTGIPVVEAVCAVRNKKEQKRLSVKQRVENARASFYFNPRTSIDGKRVILVDDVATTGSTLTAIAEILKQNGAKEVIACVFARVVHAEDGKGERLKKPIGIPLKEKNPCVFSK